MIFIIFYYYFLNMILTLKNFKCFDEAVFDLGIQGVTLIHGNSGVGKSTILSSINYLLYNKGNKIIMNGKTSCCVKLEYDDNLFIRKKPNKLIVTIKNIEYEDEIAQGVINNMFGDCFDIIGYIAQSESNFVGLNPTNKLSFLEKISFKDINIVELKEKIKTVIRDRNEELISIVAKLEITKKMFSEFPEPEHVLFPLPDLKNKIINDRVIKNEEIRYKNSIVLLKRREKDFDKITKEYNDLNIMNASIRPKDNSIIIIKTKLQDLETELLLTNYDDNNLIENKRLLKKILMNKEHTDKKNKYEEDSKQLKELEDKELLELNKRLDGFSLWTEYTEQEGIEIIDNLKIFLKVVKRYNFIQQTKDSYYVDEEKLLMDIDTFKDNKSNLNQSMIIIEELTLDIKNTEENIILYNRFSELKNNEVFYYIDEIKLQKDIELLNKLKKYKLLNIEKENYYVSDEDLQHSINLLSHKKIFSCPSCSCKLKLYMNNLSIANNDNIFCELSETELINIISLKKSNIQKYANIMSKIYDLNIEDSTICDIDLEKSINIINNKKAKYNETKEQLKTFITEPVYVSCDILVDKKNRLKSVKDSIINLSSEVNDMNLSINIRDIKQIKYKEIMTEISVIEKEYEIDRTEEDILEDINHIKLYIKNQKKLETEKTDITNKLVNSIFSSSLIYLRIDVLEQKRYINNIEENFDCSVFNEEDIRDKIIIQENLKEKIEFIYREKIKLENECCILEEQILFEKTCYIEKYRDIKEILEEDINIIRIDILNVVKDRNKYYNNLENIKKYKKRKEYEKWIININDMEEKTNINRKKLGAANVVKENIIRAESISMDSIISSINTHVQIYLNIFFTEYPISVRLVTFKETKLKSKPQINIEINYKNIDNILVSDLSGGELARLNIAFTLALVEMFNYPFIMLDESMSSLDEYHSSCVVEGIKDNFNGKLCIIVAHQTIEGMYDNVIKL